MELTRSELSDIVRVLNNIVAESIEAEAHSK